MDKDYFQSDEFKDILNAYERQKGKKKSFYLDADDFADIADYYLSVDQPSKAMEAVEQGLAIHADDDILLIVKSATLIYQQMYDEAEKLLKTLDEEDPDVQYQLRGYGASGSMPIARTMIPKNGSEKTTYTSFRRW